MNNVLPGHPSSDSDSASGAPPSERYWTNRRMLFLCLITVASVASSVILFYLLRVLYFQPFLKSAFKGTSFIEEDPLIGFRQRANAVVEHTRPPFFNIYTDNLGARVERPGKQSPAHTDILSVGCSYTWGHGVEDEETFVKIVARAGNLRAANFAVPSYGATASLLTLSERVSLKPKVVIYGFIPDHLERAIQPCAPTLGSFCRPVAYSQLSSDGRVEIKPPLDLADNYYAFMQEVFLRDDFSWRDIYWSIRSDWVRLLRQDKDSINRKYGNTSGREKQIVLETLLARIVAETRKTDSHLILVYMPLVDNIFRLPEEWQSALQKVVNGKDVSLVDLTEDFLKYQKEKGPGSLKAQGVDSHPNVEVHAMIASRIIPLVENVLRPGTALTSPIFK